MSYTLIQAFCKQGQKKYGVDEGPNFLRSLIRNSKFAGETTGKISAEEFEKKTGYSTLFRIHNKNLSEDRIPVVLGGDHSIGHITVGSSVQIYDDKILILWIDAHADINTYSSSISKNTHGTPLSGLIGLEHPWIPEIKKLLKPENLVYYGIRDLDDFEIDVLEKYKIKKINLEELKELVEKYEHVHISFDVDSLDTLYLDSTGTTSDNGITPDEVIDCINIVGNKLKALDITEFNPQVGNLKKSLVTVDYILQGIN